MVEFRRLVRVLRGRGTLGKVDIGVLTEASRIKDWLDAAYERADIDDPRSLDLVKTLTAQRRGLFREMGLTLQPGRSVLKTTAVDVDAEDDDPLNDCIRISG